MLARKPGPPRKPGKPGQLIEPWFAPFALVNGSALGLTPILLPLVAAKQGAGHVGLVMGAFNLGAFAAPITGGIADALHAHRLLATLCAALSGVTLWLFAFADSPLQLLLALLNGAGFAGAVTIATSRRLAPIRKSSVSCAATSGMVSPARSSYRDCVTARGL